MQPSRMGASVPPFFHSYPATIRPPVPGAPPPSPLLPLEGGGVVVGGVVLAPDAVMLIAPALLALFASFGDATERFSVTVPAVVGVRLRSTCRTSPVARLPGGVGTAMAPVVMLASGGEYAVRH